MKSVYELKRFKNSKHPEIIDALKLYVEYTEPAVRTDTKEIMQCLDVWNSQFEDPFFVLGFYFNDQLIGFSELAYFRQEKFVIVDYLVIHKNYRKNNTFYQFVDDIRLFLQKENLEYNYIVAEIACYHENLEPPESSKLLIRLLKLSRFGVVKCNYYVPRIGIFDFESEMRAVMMIYSLNKSNMIRKETFFQIVRAIYFKYYQRWHDMFTNLEERERYSKELNILLKRIEKQLENRKTIEINGSNSLFPTITNPEIESKARKIIKFMTGILLFGACFTLVSFFFSLLKENLGWDSSTATTIIVVSIALTLFFVALIFENKSNLFSKTFERLLDKFLML